MPRIVIYTTPFCPYCVRAKRLLTQKGATFEEIDVSGDWQARAKLAQKAGGLTTVPQIWIGDVHVGGSDELHALDRAGKLDALLGACD
jgi:glutaredoxin 3